MISAAFHSFTRPADTTQYADGDLVANSTTAGSVTPMNFTTAGLRGASGLILGVRLFKDVQSVSAAIFRVHLFSQSPSVSNGDNGAFAPTTLEHHIGYIELDATSVSGTGITSVTDAAATKLVDPPLPFDLSILGGRRRAIYGLLESKSTPALGSAELLRVTLLMSDGL